MKDIHIEVKKQDSFLAAVYNNGLLYYSSWLRNGLFVLDLESGVAKLLDTFEEKTEQGLHIAAGMIDNEIWFFPAKAEKIAKYNIEVNKITYIMKIDSATDKFKFASILDLQDRVVLIPKSYDTVIEIDKSDGTIKKLWSWSDKNNINSKVGCNFNCAVMEKEYLYLFPSEKEEYFYKVNTIKEDSTVKLNFDLVIDDALLTGDEIYLLAENKLYKFDGEKNPANEFLTVGNYKEKYRKMFLFDEKIWIFPYIGNFIVIYEPSSGNIEKLCLVSDSDDDTFAFYGKIDCGNFEIVTSSFGKCQYLSVEKDLIKTISCRIDGMSVIRCLLQKSDCKKNRDIIEKETGKKIYKYICSI